jgi:hypothetical protein
MQRLRILIPLSLAVVGLNACGRSNPAQQVSQPAPQPAMKPAPPAPIGEKKQELGGNTWDPQWDAVVEKDLPPAMLSAQAAHAVASYCPRFAEEPEADKRAFWAYTFQALAGAEAGLNPTADAHHTDPAVNTTDAVSKRPVRQEGLLQLTYEDAQRYDCDFDYAHDRTLPEKDPNRSILRHEQNLACGIKIMRHQIIDENKPLIVRSSYWSTLQPGTGAYRVFAKQVANVPPACGIGVRSTTRRPARALASTRP